MALGDGMGLWRPDLGQHLNVAQPSYDMVQAQAQAHQQAYTEAQIRQAMQAGAPSGAPNPLHERAREMFLKRLGGLRAEHKVKLGDFVAAHVHGTTVYLFYVFDGKEGVTKEDIDLFPSDQLITQFRMILA